LGLRVGACLLAAALALCGCGSQSPAPSSSAGSAAAESGPAAAGSYTFAWMSDTQYYSASYPYIYDAMTKWLGQNTAAWNIRAVLHTGDVVDDMTQTVQWRQARAAMALLDPAVPLCMLAGNNDVNDDTADYTAYLANFGSGYYTFRDGAQRQWFQDGRAQAMLLDVGAQHWLFLALGYGVGQEAVDWAAGVLKQYPDRTAVLMTHDYLKDDGTRSKNGKELYKALVKPFANLRLVLCGHKSEALVSTEALDDNGDGTNDRTVCQMLCDYQNGEKGGSGYLRLMTVDPAAGTLTVRTYSPYLDQYDYYKPAQYPQKDEFVLDISEWFKK